jgi:hypothetical protein
VGWKPGRFKSFIIEQDKGMLMVLRYVW